MGTCRCCVRIFLQIFVISPHVARNCSRSAQGTLTRIFSISEVVKATNATLHPPRLPCPQGKFRSFLLASLKNFLGHAYDREQTLKRSGSLDFLPLDDAGAKAAESLFQTHFVSAE